MDKRWVETVQLILLFCALGISIAMLGPSLPDLAFNTNTSLKKYNVVFFCRAFGTLTGTITAGYLVDHFNYCFFLPFAAFAHAACYYFIPFTDNIWLVAVCISCSGLTSSGKLTSKSNSNKFG